MRTDAIVWRRLPDPADAAAVARLCKSTGFFNPGEVAVARELVTERLAKGLASGYRFWLAGPPGRLAGYACYGPIAGTLDSWDLYWIVVAPEGQGRGLGGKLLTRVCQSMRKAGGGRLYAETSSRSLYTPTHAFYLRKGFIEQARLPGFYAPDDDKVVYCLEVPRP